MFSSSQGLGQQSSVQTWGLDRVLCHVIRDNKRTRMQVFWERSGRREPGMGRGLIIEDKLGLLDPVCSQYGSAALSYHWSLGSETLWFSFSHLLPGSVGAGTEGIKESYFYSGLYYVPFAYFGFFLVFLISFFWNLDY